MTLLGRSLRLAFLLVVFPLFVARPTPAAPTAPGSVIAATTEARRLAAAGAWPDAVTLLQAQLAACEASGEGGECRLLVNFTLGYLTARQATGRPGERDRLLREAAQDYERALVEDPGRGSILANLAGIYRELGDDARAEALLQQGLAGAPEGAARFALLLGDLYREAGRLDEALASYRRAMDREPEADGPRRRIVDLYDDLPDDRLDEVLRSLAAWAPRFPELAERGYRGVIARTYVTAPSKAEAALLQWVTVLAQARSISLRRLDELPAGWQAPAVRDLRRYLEAPERRPDGGSWWLGRAERRQVLAEVALAVGRQRLAEADPPGAAARWEPGRGFAPPFEDYAFGALRAERPRLVLLDLQTELASLYFKFHDRLDRDGKRLDQVIASIFQSKAEAYKLNDLEGIQRHHSVLGVIYAQLGKWSGGGYTNGIFQLEHALAAAAGRDRETHGYQPLPELKALLVDGYLATGGVAAARRLALGAAQAYLDTDDPARASTLLARPALSWDQAPADQRAPRESLLRVVATRQAVAAPPGPAFRSGAPGFAFAEDGPHGWLFASDPLPSLALDFTARQRFKVLADLSQRARASGQDEAVRLWGDRAFALAVDEVATLTGAGDLLRLERTKAQLVERTVADPRVPRVSSQPAASGARGRTWTLSLASDARPTFVQIGPDAVLAARVSRMLHDDPIFLGKSLTFTVRDSDVTIFHQGDETLAAAAVREIGRLSGVGQVMIQQ